MSTSCKNWKKQVSTQKSTNNSMSSFGLIEENVELSHVHLAVHKLGLAVTTYILNSSIDLIIHKNPKVTTTYLQLI